LRYHFSSEKERVLVNPFVFPSELNLYFILMLLCLSAPALGLGFSVIAYFADPSFQPDPGTYSLIVFPLLTLALLPFLILLFYKEGIRGKIKKYSGNRLEHRYPEMSDLVGKLCRRIEIKIPINFFVDSEELNALAFGSMKQNHLLVSSGLCEKLSFFPDLVETILTHELAHLKNRDVVQHEVAESLWKSFAIVGAICSIYGLAVNYDWISGWLTLVLFIYAVPFLVIFYLNSALNRWREIYADVRAVALQGSDRNIVNTLRLLSPSVRSFSFTKLFAPFVLTPIKRTKIIQEDVFKHVVERTMICAVVGTASLFMSLFLLPFLFRVTTINQQTFLAFILFGLYFLLYSTALLPYWAYSSKEVVSSRQNNLNLVITPLRITLISTGPAILILLGLSGGSALDLAFFLLILTYLFLFVDQLLFQFIVSSVSLRIEARTKIYLCEIPMLVPVGVGLLYLLNMVDSLPTLIGFIVIPLGLFLVILTYKFPKCPYCGREVLHSSLFQCHHCLSKLNEEFMIFLKD